MATAQQSLDSSNSSDRGDRLSNKLAALSPENTSINPSTHVLKPHRRDLQAVYNKLNHNIAVANITHQQRTELGIEIIFTFDEEYKSHYTAEDVLSDINVPKNIYATTKSGTPVSNRCYHPTEQEGSITVCSHPLEAAIDVAKAKTGLNLTPVWETAGSELPTSQLSIKWEDTPPISLTHNLIKKETLEQFKTHIKSFATPNDPATYVCILSHDIKKKLDDDNDDKSTKVAGKISIEYEKVPEPADITNRSTSILQCDATNLTLYGELPIKSGSEPAQQKLSQNKDQNTTTPRINLTITSPPYADAINYGAFCGEETDFKGETGCDIENTTSQSTPDEILAEWVKEQKEIFNTVYNLTKEGGYCAIIIGNTKVHDTKLDLESNLSVMMTTELDWTLQEKITWAKLTEGESANGFQTTAAHNHPTYYHANRQTERILVFRKGEKDQRKGSVEIDIGNKYVTNEVANDLWHIPPIPPNASVNHPCPYPAEIPYRLISLYTHPGDIVFDPMAGSGTTIMTANELGRNAIGTDIEPKFIHETRRRTFVEGFDRNNPKIPPEEYPEVETENASILSTPGDSKNNTTDTTPETNSSKNTTSDGTTSSEQIENTGLTDFL